MKKHVLAKRKQKLTIWKILSLSVLQKMRQYVLKNNKVVAGLSLNEELIGSCKQKHCQFEKETERGTVKEGCQTS